MKAYVVTYCTWRSYGSVLQSLGLKNALDGLGCESCILQTPPSLNRKKKSGGKSLKTSFIDFYDFLIRSKTKKAYERGNAFIDSNIEIKYYKDDVMSLPDIADCDFYLAGSDQIWHPGLCDPVFFLNFAENGKKRLSYAASMGNTKIPAEREKTFSEYINNFDVISVRENECAEVIRKYTDKSLSVNIDPTFLCTAEFWRGHATQYRLNTPYILVYAIYWDKKLNAELKALSRRTKLPIVAIATHYQNVYADKRIYDAGPAEFLWLIDNAEYVITSSFHGTALATIFNKKCSVIINPASPSRLNSLMNTLSIKPVPISGLDGAQNPTDYAQINKNIEAERKRSLDFLREMIEGI